MACDKRRQVEATCPGRLLADGFDDAIIGYDARTNNVIYSYSQCVDILCEGGDMDRDQATEYLEFNTVSAYMGEHTPHFMVDIPGSGVNDKEIARLMAIIDDYCRICSLQERDISNLTDRVKQLTDGDCST